MAASSPAPATDAPLTLADIARAQAGKGHRVFTLAPGHEWHRTGSGKVGVTVGRNDVLMLSHVPEGGRIAEVPVDVLMACPDLAVLYATAVPTE